MIIDVIEGSWDVVIKVDMIVLCGVELVMVIDLFQIEEIVIVVNMFSLGFNFLLECVDQIVVSVDFDCVGVVVDGVVFVIDNINNQ